MKQFFFGMLAAFVLSTLTNLVWLKSERGTTTYKISKYLKFNIIEGDYVLNPLVGNCRDVMGKNGHGWVFNVADYYGCDRFQRLLNGNFKSQDPNSPRY